MTNLIKQAQTNVVQAELIIERCQQYNVPYALVESLDGVLHSYIQRINSGQMKTLDYDDIYGLANVFAFASMLGAIEAPNVDTRAANALINLYQQARPGDPTAIANRIRDVVDHMEPARQSEFKQMANAWGRSLSQAIRSQDPAVMKAISNRLLKAVHTMNPAMERMAQRHGDGIGKQKIRASHLARQLGV